MCRNSTTQAYAIFAESLAVMHFAARPPATGVARYGEWCGDMRESRARVMNLWGNRAYVWLGHVSCGDIHMSMYRMMWVPVQGFTQQSRVVPFNTGVSSKFSRNCNAPTCRSYHDRFFDVSLLGISPYFLWKNDWLSTSYFRLLIRVIFACIADITWRTLPYPFATRAFRNERTLFVVSHIWIVSQGHDRSFSVVVSGMFECST